MCEMDEMPQKILAFTGCGCRTQRVLKRELSDLSTTDFCFVKFYRMPFWSHTIQKLGSANLISTAYGERAHADAKTFKRHTNRHADAKEQVWRFIVLPKIALERRRACDVK